MSDWQAEWQDWSKKSWREVKVRICRKSQGLTAWTVATLLVCIISRTLDSFLKKKGVFLARDNCCPNSCPTVRVKHPSDSRREGIKSKDPPFSSQTHFPGIDLLLVFNFRWSKIVLFLSSLLSSRTKVSVEDTWWRGGAKTFKKQQE